MTNGSESYKRDIDSLVLNQRESAFLNIFLDGLSLMDWGISFQKKLPIMLRQNLLRLVRNKGIATWLDDALRVL